MNKTVMTMKEVPMEQEELTKIARALFDAGFTSYELTYVEEAQGTLSVWFRVAPSSRKRVSTRMYVWPNTLCLRNME